jgi:hypothetical protein
LARRNLHEQIGGFFKSWDRKPACTSGGSR